MVPLDLKVLASRESEQVEWKENVADCDSVVATICAFANDHMNLGGGYVVCGVRETVDEHGFQRQIPVGLSASRLKEIEGTVLTRCRERVSPPLTPWVEELPAETEDRRLLVFVVPATRHAHVFRRDRDEGAYYIRVGRSTRQARNGLLLQLLTRKNEVEAWDRRPCEGATLEDLDIYALTDTLKRIQLFSPERGTEVYLSDTEVLSPMVPPLCVREPLTRVLRPRNFAMLLFGRNLQRFVPGAISFFSQYGATTRSEPLGERHELFGTLLDQAGRLVTLLDSLATTLYDKEDMAQPSVLKYPARALREAVINALVHRNYQMVDPLRVTAFSDRVEIVSPGALPLGMTVQRLRSGKATPVWRNQALAWFFNRLGYAEAEGQGIQTMLESLRASGCPPPRFEADEARVTCTVKAHPRAAKVGRRLREQAE